MAKLIGIAGLPNSGKSFSRSFIKEGEKCFIIMPSSKNTYLTTSKGEPLKRLQVSTASSKSLEEMRDKINASRLSNVIPSLLKKETKDLTITGNYLVSELINVEDLLKFIDKHMPHITTIFIPDVTHFVSSVIANREFISRKAGGDAYQRFWELAGDILNSLVESVADLREDLIIITEYHVEFNETNGLWELFMPGGKMVLEKFKLDSYYDDLLYTHVELKEDGGVSPDSYKFVTRRYKHYNARTTVPYTEIFIPNNLEDFLKRFRNKNI